MQALWIVLAVCAALGAVYLFLIAPGKKPPGYKLPEVRAFAHRGLWDGNCPENSLAAFQKAVDKGYGIETDVRLSADGVLFLFHDDTLSRMTGDGRKTDDLSLGELYALRLAGGDQVIPTLEDLLTLVSGRVPLILEIKPGRQVEAVCENLAQRLKTYQGPCMVESFDPRAVRWFKKHCPGILRGQLVASRPEKKLPFKQALVYALMDSLIMNGLGRPHFMALDLQAFSSLPGRLVRLFRPIVILWTVQNREEWQNNTGQCDGQIFEGFEA